VLQPLARERHELGRLGQERVDTQRVQYRASAIGQRSWSVLSQEDEGGEGASAVDELDAAAATLEALDRLLADRQRPCAERLRTHRHRGRQLQPLDDDDGHRVIRNRERGHLTVARLRPNRCG
jgi:hypothetical protein